MKKALLYFSLCFSFILSAQVTNEGIPKSWDWESGKSIRSITMPSFDLKALQEEDAVIDQLNDRPWRFGKEFIVNYSLNNSGEWTELKNGDRVWRIRFKSPGAITMNFLFEDFYLPLGSTVYLYNNNRTDLLGAYDHKQNSEERVLGTWLVDGDDVWIEYYEPAKVKNIGKLMIGKVVHGYRSQNQFATEKGLNDSGSCNQDVDCPIGEFEALKNHNKKGVGILLSGGSGFCSGSLINNTANNGTPYFLTANHCYSNPSTWAFRFNWISPNPVCATTANSTNGPTTQTISGGTLKARRQQSDFCLVEINNPIPSSWGVVFNGWDRSETVPAKTWGVHHPSGDIMKVCVDNNAPGLLNPNGENVWRIYDWDLGVTEGGSSGSPLFDPNGRIIGQLWRGTAACSGTNDNGGWDEYGRFGVSWDTGSTLDTRLREWLDPAGTNPMILDPYPNAQVYNIDAALAISNVPSQLCSNQLAPVLTLKNLGSMTLTSATISYQLNTNATSTINWTGSLATGAQTSINLNPISITGSGSFTAILTNPNGQADQFQGDNGGTVSFVVPPSFTTAQVNLSLVLDQYPDETTWTLKNSAGTILYSGGPYAAGQAGQTINTVFTLNTDDCYTFRIVDDFGDGICCGEGNGSFTLTTQGGTQIATGGSFSYYSTTTFKNFQNLGTNDTNLSSLISVYPNPTGGVIHISNNTGNSLNYEVYTILGQTVSKGSISANLHSLDLSGNASGLYFVKLTDPVSNGSATKKLVIK